MSLVDTTKGLVKRALRQVVSRSEAPPPPTPAHWGLEITPQGRLALEGLDLHALGTAWGFPVHVVNGARLRANAQRFLTTPAGQPTGCEVFYSYKTNPVPGALRRLHALGIGAEVISHYELWLAQQLGVPADKIVFNGPGKSEAGIAEAVSAGVQVLNVNHREEIAAVARVAERLQTTGADRHPGAGRSGMVRAIRGPRRRRASAGSIRRGTPVALARRRRPARTPGRHDPHGGRAAVVCRCRARVQR